MISGTRSPPQPYNVDLPSCEDNMYDDPPAAATNLYDTPPSCTQEHQTSRAILQDEMQDTMKVDNLHPHQDIEMQTLRK